MNNSKERTRMLVSMAMLSAISIVLAYIIHIPLIPGVPYLEYDPADVTILIGTFAYGPLAGFIITVVVSIIQGMTVSAIGGPIGILMHILATGGFALLAGVLYKRDKSKKGAMIALICGSIFMVILMVICNIIFTPLYTGLSQSEVINMLVPIIIPFNVLKAGINSVITFVVYKRVSKYLHSR